mgnify:CR=1 FL=1
MTHEQSATSRKDKVALRTLRRRGALLAIAMVAVVGAGIARPGASGAESYRPVTGSGDLQAYVNAYVAKNPGRDSGAYRLPSSTEQNTMRAAWRLVVQGDLSGAAAASGPLGYQVLRYTDTSTNRVIVLLAERSTKDGKWARGWGLFGWATTARGELFVEVTHPVADIDTEDVGVIAFRRASGRALFVAGAHRQANRDGSADVAHRTDAIFHVLHTNSASASSTVFQPHGYADETTPEDAVISRGDLPDDLAARVASDLRAEAFTVCLYDGASCSSLAGTTNVQGIVTRRAGGRFLHAEIARRIRLDVARRDRLASVISSAVV